MVIKRVSRVPPQGIQQQPPGATGGEWVLGGGVEVTWVYKDLEAVVRAAQ